MKKSSIIVGVIVAIALVVVLVYYSGAIPGFNTFITSKVNSLTGSTGDNCDYDNNEIFQALEVLSGKTLNYAEAMGYIEALHMQMCGIDGKNYQQVYNEYKADYENHGYVFVSQGANSGTDWYTMNGLWRNAEGTEAKALIAGSGAAVSLAYDHDTMILQAHGSYATWAQFWIFLNS